jgi:hypothetical protein
MKLIVGAQAHKSSGVATCSGATPIPLTKIGLSSSANTTFTDTRVTDGTAWSLTNVAQGDVAVSSDGKRGIVVSTGTNIVNVGQWVDKGGSIQTPANGSTVAIHRLNLVRRLWIKAPSTNIAAVYIGLYGTADSTDYPLAIGEAIEILPDGDAEWLDVTKIYQLVAGGTQYLNYAQGFHV